MVIKIYILHILITLYVLYTYILLLLSGTSSTTSISVDQPNFTKPLQKSEVFELANPEKSTIKKWEKVRDKRRERETMRENNKRRQDLVENLTQTVINCEK